MKRCLTNLHVICMVSTALLLLKNSFNFKKCPGSVLIHAV